MVKMDACCDCSMRYLVWERLELFDVHMQLALPFFNSSVRANSLADWLIGSLRFLNLCSLGILQISLELKHHSFSYSACLFILSFYYYSINYTLINSIMLSSCRLIARPAVLRSSLPRSIALRSASAWAHVAQGPPVRP